MQFSKGVKLSIHTFMKKYRKYIYKSKRKAEIEEREHVIHNTNEIKILKKYGLMLL